LQAAMTEEVEAVAEQVEVVYFAAGTEELVGIFQERLNSGEDHEALLEEVRNDEDDQSLGQTLPWFPQDYLSSQFGPDFAQVAFNTPVGQASEPFQIPETDMGYFVLYVLGHEEQPLSEQLLAEAGQTRYAEWVDAQMAEKVERLDWQSALPEE